MLPVLSWEALIFGIQRDRWEGLQLKPALASIFRDLDLAG
jgi:hypothetical protein